MTLEHAGMKPREFDEGEVAALARGEVVCESCSTKDDRIAELERKLTTAKRFHADEYNNRLELAGQVKALQTECERLRDSLVHIEEYWNGRNAAAPDAAYEMREIARAARSEHTVAPGRPASIPDSVWEEQYTKERDQATENQEAGGER